MEGDVAGPAGAVRGRPINPQPSRLTLSTKLSFLPLPWTRLGYPRNFQLLTEPLPTIVTINRCYPRY